MNIRLLATAALLCAGLSGCAIDPYALSGANWYPPSNGGAYYQPTTTYWVTPTYTAAPQTYVYARPDESRRPHRDHDRDGWGGRNEHRFGGH